MIHYTYKRDGGQRISAASSSRAAAYDWLRSVFRPGERIRIYWPQDATGSAWVQEWIVAPEPEAPPPVYRVEELDVSQLPYVEAVTVLTAMIEATLTPWEEPK